MKNSVLIFSVLFCMLTIPYSVYGIRCYSCDNVVGGDCSNLNNDMIKDCPIYSTTCIKTFAKGPNVDIINRGCGPIIKVLDNDCKADTINGYEGTYCECDRDLCNGTSSIYTKSAIFISLLMAIAVKFVFQ